MIDFIVGQALGIAIGIIIAPLIAGLIGVASAWIVKLGPSKP